MGRLKDSLLDQLDWDRSPDRFVSAGCFEDPALQTLVDHNLTSCRCSYSGRVARRPIAAALDVVVEAISAGLRRHYDAAGNGVGWEGGWVGADVWDTHDLVEDTVELSPDAQDTLLRDIVAALPMQDWSRHNPYGARDGDVLSWGWRDFTDTVKHVRRYFFEQHLGPTDPRSEKVSLIDLLGEMAAKARSYGLFRDLPAGQSLFRSRRRDTRTRIVAPLEMGPPPPARASQSRMSPAGIAMFYGAYAAETAVAETIRSPGRYAVARFSTNRPIRVLDLTKAPWVSIFDERRGHLAEWCRFMGAFIRDFQRPVGQDGSEHFEYSPTQVVTEFLRSDASRHGGLDGILYRSVQRHGGNCIVLFATQSDVDPVVAGAVDPKFLLRMERVWNRRHPA